MPVRVLIPIRVLACPLLVMGICTFWYQHKHDYNGTALPLSKIMPKYEMKTWEALAKKNLQIAGVSARCFNATAVEKHMSIYLKNILFCCERVC
jgi:hypothetical protein